jgi:hypothetical protein
MPASRRKPKKETYDFTLILGRKPRLTVKAANALYEAGCDDALVAIICGIGQLDFDREGDSCQSAVLSAIEDVEGAGIGARVECVESNDGKNTDMIAALNAVLELRRKLQRPADAVELVGALSPRWS